MISKGTQGNSTSVIQSTKSKYSRFHNLHENSHAILQLLDK